MFEKNLEMSFLLDFYGDILSERRRSVMTMYYNEDLSLSEIASEIGISRQGVRDLIKKSEEELSLLEEKLGYVLFAKSSHDISLNSPTGVHLELHHTLIEQRI